MSFTEADAHHLQVDSMLAEMDVFGWYEKVIESWVHLSQV